MISHQPGAARKILAADVTDLLAAIDRAVANGEHFEVVAVVDGLDAMHALVASPFDLAIIDIAMPSLDALRLIALIRATPSLRRLPILAVAAPNEPQSTLEGLRAGANDYIARPIEWPQLVMRVRQLVG